MNRLSTPKVLLLAGACLVAELTLLDDLAWLGGRLELLLLVAVFAALFARDRRQALLTCWLVGLVKDLGSAGPLGLHAVLFLGVGWTIHGIKQLLFRESAVMQAGVAAAGCAAVAVATALFVSVTVGGVPPSLWLTKTVMSALVTALLAPAFVRLLLTANFLVR
jgi:rod shape-determining protein MreD